MLESPRGKNEELWGTPFDNTVWEKVLHLGQKLGFPSGHIISPERYRGIFYIRKGRVKISYLSQTGKEISALYYSEGAIFNEARTFSALSPEGAFTCLEDCELFFFPRTTFRSGEFITRNPQIIKNLLSTMGDKILIHYYALTNLRAETDLINTAKFIYQLYRENQALSFKIAYSQQDIADMLGVHRTTVARSLKKLRAHGIISACSRHNITISNLPKLQLLAENCLLEEEDEE